MVIEWDPLGLICDGAPPDEYDCILPEILHRLQEKVSTEQMSKELITHISDHFGVSPDRETTQEFCRKAVDWYKTYWDGSIM